VYRRGESRVMRCEITVPVGGGVVSLTPTMKERPREASFAQTGVFYKPVPLGRTSLYGLGRERGRLRQPHVSKLGVTS
jgi:hypothetical protein